MYTDKASALTRDFLARKGGTMGDLPGYFRNRVSPPLIDNAEWESVLAEVPRQVDKIFRSKLC